MNSYFLQSALLPQGWQHNVRVSVKLGRIKSVELNAKPQSNDQTLGVVIPAMPNVHSHVFQRAMAGLSEYKTAGRDSFWSWRELMYQLAEQLDAETLYQVAKKCYIEMLQAGYASVCEFHYVHRAKDDLKDFYSHSEILLKAADEVGLPITMLPVLYAFSGVGDKPLNAEQQRFELSVDEYIELYRHLQDKLKANQNLGICFHSIRAVNKVQMQTVIDSLPKNVPIHIHIAEQQAEIDQSIEHLGMRPVTWLFDNFQVDKRWNLVHATHLDDSEIKLIAASGAVAVLCPLTEANLGDGIFPMPDFKKQGGTWAIGSDSHIEIKPQQELKMLEYSQRLIHQQRNVCADGKHAHVGTWQWLQAVAGGNQASGQTSSQAGDQKLAGIEVGCLGQVVELVTDENMGAEQTLDAWIFSDQVKSKPCSL